MAVRTNKKKLTGFLFSPSGLVVILGVIFYPQVKKIVILIKSFINGFSDFFISPEDKIKKAALQDWLDKLERSINYDGLNPDFDNHDIVASRLYEFFDHLGTSNLNIIRDTFLDDRVTVDDLKLTIVKYGIKTTHLFFFDDVTGTLVDHINSELSGDLHSEIMGRLNDLQIL